METVDTPGFRTISAHLPDLTAMLASVTPGILGNLLQAKEIITLQQKQQATMPHCMTQQGQIQALTDYVLVCSRPGAFRDFMDVLVDPTVDHFKTLEALRDKMIAKYIAEGGQWGEEEESANQHVENGGRNSPQAISTDYLAGVAVFLGNTVGSIIPYKCPHCGVSKPISSYGGNVVQGHATCPSCYRNIFGPD